MSDSPYPPAPQTLNIPNVPPEVKRDQNIGLRVWLKNGLQFDIPMPDGFDLHMWASHLRGHGHFVDWRASVYFPADEVVMACAFKGEPPKGDKAIPFGVVDGGKPAA